jgi:hypothetical protein
MASKEVILAFAAGAAVATGVGALLFSNDQNMGGENSPGVRLIQEILLPKIMGRLDHTSLDRKRKLMFFSCLGDNSVVVLDVFAGKVVQKILHGSFSEPQGILFVQETCRLYVANAGNGCVTVFQGELDDAAAWLHIKTLDFDDEADNLRYDSKATLVYVGYGEGALGVIDEMTVTKIYELSYPCLGHPESFQLCQKTSRAFINVKDEAIIQVHDISGRNSPPITWRLPDGVSHNFPMALDDTGERLFVATRRPSCVLVIDTRNGTIVNRVPCCGDMDDMYFDSRRRRLYVIGGEGVVSTIQQRTRKRLWWGSSKQEEYERSDAPSSVGARTGLWFDTRDRLYVCAPATGSSCARVLVYEPIM